MSTAADDQYEQQNDTTTGDVPSGVKTDDDYASRTGQYQIPVQKDETPVTDPIDPATADSDEMLAQDDKDAIDQSNIVGGGRTKGAKVAGGYKEPGDEEGMPPADDGTSRGASSS